MNNGIEGLGNINTINDKTNVNSPYSFLAKTDTDSRKLVTDGNKFLSDEQYGEYLKNWFEATDIFDTKRIVKDELQSDEVSFIFYAQLKREFANTPAETIFCIYAFHNLENVKNTLKLLKTTGSTINNVPSVVMGCFHCDEETRLELKQLGFSITGLDEIYEINQAIDNGLNGLRYCGVNYNKFHTKLAAWLNMKYNKECTNSTVGIISNNIKNEAQSLGNDISTSFKEGFEQMRDSVGGVLQALHFKGNSSQTREQLTDKEIAEQVQIRG